MEDYRKKAKRKCNRGSCQRAKNKTKNNGEVVITDENIQHPKERRKIREKRLACGNSAAVNAPFKIDPEEYL